MVHPLVDYFRCPEEAALTQTGGPLTGEEGYFTFDGAVCYGHQGMGAPSSRPDKHLVEVSSGVSLAGGKVLLPFDLSEVLDNLRYERYPNGRIARDRLSAFNVAHSVYYFFRPFLPVGVRKHLQKLRFAGWTRIPFPGWPVDATVDALMKKAVGLVLDKCDIREFPFIWFWPDGAPGCAMLTHDVEGIEGARFCGELMDLDESFGIGAAFQVVPDAPWSSRSATMRLVGQLRGRGFEVNVHDLTHDGQLFRNREMFLRYAAEINTWGQEFGSRGFRSGAMYRRQDWFGALDFSYDMSVPNVAHLEPQRGGCCTVMPFFIGRVVELPLTAVQDYTLFHVLGDYSTRVWQEQIDRILRLNGLVSFIVHPDYLLEPAARAVYTDLLRILARLRAEQKALVALPSEIEDWWRNRREMRLVPDGEGWCVEGPGSERARVAYARLVDGRVVYEIGRSQPAEQEQKSVGHPCILGSNHAGKIYRVS